MWLAWMFACSHAPVAIPTDAAGPPALHLSVDNLVEGDQARVVVTGAAPGARVRVAWSMAFGWSCPAPLTDTCWELAVPTDVLPFTATADAAGAATFTVRPPPGSGGSYVVFSAVVRDPAGPSPISQAAGRAVAQPGVRLTPDGDRDGDGYSIAMGDCADFAAAFHPGALDPAGDGVDLDCDGHDGGDADGDGSAPGPQPGADCNDQDPAIGPGVPDDCDGVDNDCDGAIDQDAAGQTCGIEETFLGGQTAADLLVVVDNSGSMLQEQVDLAAASAALWTELDPIAADLHLGFVTTDMDDPTQSGRLLSFDGYNHASAGDDFATFFEMGVQRGVLGSGFEMGIDASVVAVTPPLALGHNAGFVRDDAHLFVLFLSDEPDHSAMGDAASWLAWAGTFRTDGLRTQAHGIVGPPGGCATADDSDDYRQLIAGTRGTWADICQPPYDDALATLGREIRDATSGRVWRLTRPADPATIEVIVRTPGMPDVPAQPATYTYDPTQSVLKYTGPAFAGNVTLIVRYNQRHAP
jgi:hypothetical protein